MIEKIGGCYAVLQINGFDEALGCKRAGGFPQLKEDIGCGLREKGITLRGRLYPSGMNGGHGNQKPMQPRQTGEIFQIKLCTET